MKSITLYGLTFASEVDLSTITRAREGADGAGRADAIIRYAAVPDSRPDDLNPAGPFSAMDRDRFWFEVPKVARYEVVEGREIRISPAPGSDDASIRVFLLGTALGALLMQRGFVVLHGNAIDVGGRCVVCVGDSGAGKSTLSAACLTLGHRVLADDVVAVDRDGRVIPGLPRMKLWAEAARGLGIETTTFERVRPGLEKFDVPITERFGDSALPLAAVFDLATHELDELRIEARTGAERFRVLREHFYRPHFLGPMGRERELLPRLATLAGRVPTMAGVLRPQRGLDPRELARELLARTEPPTP